MDTETINTRIYSITPIRESTVSNSVLEIIPQTTETDTEHI